MPKFMPAKRKDSVGKRTYLWYDNRNDAPQTERSGDTQGGNFLMSGMMNKFYYGNAGKADYTPDQLPANRVSLFMETLRMHFGGLFGVNLACTIAALPALIWSYINFELLLGLLDTASTDAAAAAALNSSILTYGVPYFLVLIPCLMIASAFNPGVVYIVRNWARDQHTFTFSDYWDAVKVDWKGGLLLGFLNGVSLLITFVAFMVYGNMSQGNPMGYFFQTVIVALCCIWWMATMLMMPMMVTYDMPFGTVVKNSLIMVLGRLPMSLLIWVPSVILPAVIAIAAPYGMAIVIVLYLLVGFAFTYFLHVSYANSCFDIYLNPRIEGAQVNMGLRDPSHAEEDVEVTDEDIKNL